MSNSRHVLLLIALASDRGGAAARGAGEDDPDLEAPQGGRSARPVDALLRGPLVRRDGGGPGGDGERRDRALPAGATAAQEAVAAVESRLGGGPMSDPFA